MAKVTGPLLSMSASGTVGSTLTFSTSGGTVTAKIPGKPSNPKSLAQSIMRNRTRVTGAITKFINKTKLYSPDSAVTEKMAWKAICPAGSKWNTFMILKLTGDGSARYDAARAAWELLTSEQKSAWDSAAFAFVPSIPDVIQKGEKNAPLLPVTRGQVFFIYQYARPLLGEIDDIGTIPGLPTGTPPVYTTTKNYPPDP